MRHTLPKTYEMMLDYNRAVSVEQVEKVTHRHLAEYGITHMLAGVLPTRAGRPDSLRNMVLMGAWPEEWSRRYFDKLHIMKDPTIRHALTSDDYLLWKDLNQRPLNPAERLVMDEARAFRMGDGITISQLTVEGNKIGMSFAGPAIDTSPEARIHFQIVSALALGRVLQIHSLYGDLERHLTQRERECLSWLAEGKTAADIATILAVSVKAVEKHLAGARQKLGSNTSAQAIAEAMRRGFIR